MQLLLTTVFSEEMNFQGMGPRGPYGGGGVHQSQEMMMDPSLMGPVGGPEGTHITLNQRSHSLLLCSMQWLIICKIHFPS
jgi:hypothetical protein